MSEIIVNDFYQYIGKLCDLIIDKNGYFDVFLIYVIVLEQGIIKGFYVYLILVINRLKYQSDYKIVEGVIDKWKEIIFDKGFGWNINMIVNKDNYEK